MNYEHFSLTDIDLRELDVIKENIFWLDEQDHSRWVLRTRKKSAAFGSQELYLKIWNPTYIRRDNILAGIDVGFYDDQITPALVGLIFHRGFCRGYVVRKCTPNWGAGVDELFDLIKEKSEQTGFFSYQFSRYHIMRYKNRLNLIDLEGIYPIRDLPLLARYQSRFDDRNYEDFITAWKAGESERFRQLLKRTALDLVNARHPRQTFRTGTGRKRAGKRVLAVGTDCSCGKMYTMLAMEKTMRERGMKADFRATGQTGILIVGDGVAIDAVVSDFISGAVEWLAPESDADHWDLIEGQGSLFHPAFAGVSLGLLHGAQADALVLCHEPTRTHMRGLPHQPLPSLEECLERNVQAGQLTNADVRCIGLSINTSALTEAEATDTLRSLEDRFGLPAVDPFRQGADKLVDAL